MLIQHDISYLLHWDEDTIPIEANMTLGNHLENDLVVSGEDVHDYHLRIEQSDRGPVLVPLGDATINVNGYERNSPLQVIIGDIIGIGQATLQVGVEVEQDSESDAWYLANEAGQQYQISGEISVGRSDSADILIPNEHISRHHARLIEHQNYVWLQDLGSANGTRVNNVPLQGGVRLFHGDQVYFDRLSYQILARGHDLTPIAQHIDALQPISDNAANLRQDKTLVMALDDDTESGRATSNNPTARVNVPSGVEAQGQSSESRVPAKTDIGQPAQQRDNDIEEVATDLAKPQHDADPVTASKFPPGAFLLGTSAAIEGKTYQLRVGENRIGRAPSNEVVLNDQTVSGLHARINIRPENTILTNELSTNGTRVNNSEVSMVELADGDIIRIGKVTLVYKDMPPSSVAQHPLLQKLDFWMLVATCGVAFAPAIGTSDLK